MNVHRPPRKATARGQRERAAVVQRGSAPDALGYDTSDFLVCARVMAAAALSGRNRASVKAEIAAVEKRYASKA